jgi:hypothetical protein
VSLYQAPLAAPASAVVSMPTAAGK